MKTKKRIKKRIKKMYRKIDYLWDEYSSMWGEDDQPEVDQANKRIEQIYRDIELLKWVLKK